MSDKIKANFPNNAILQKILIKDVMTSPVITIHINEKFSKVEELFIEHRIRHIPVVDSGDKIVGIMTQRDLYKALAPRKFIDQAVSYRKDVLIDGNAYYMKEVLDSYILKHIMQKDPKTLKGENTLGEAIGVMVNEKAGSVSIVNDQRNVVGLITRFDILKIADMIFNAPAN